MQGKEIETHGGMFELFFKGWLGKDSENVTFERDLKDMREWVVVPGKRNNRCKDFEASMILECGTTKSPMCL